MPETGVQFGISNAAVARAAEAMLRSLGGSEISLVFPLVTMPADPSAQLGLADPGIVQVKLAPVAVRTLATASTGPRRRLEFLISSFAVAAEMPGRNASSPESFFGGALGVLYDGEIFHIVNLQTEYFAGVAYLFRVEAVE
ncbi:MAG: hypothetical protein JST79_10455 [Acidobacteria bacterium]|nr:hypothetical protein [Acidobacteriota bacterium]